MKAKADLVAFVSTYEGFGVPILEAQATGRVVISGNISPLTEVSGGGALLVDPSNSDEIKKGILQITENETLRNNLIQIGLENVKKYSAKSVAAQYFELYKTII
jgi:glycosyltransferase involved in cell wall biosynthesis